MKNILTLLSALILSTVTLAQDELFGDWYRIDPVNLFSERIQISEETMLAQRYNTYEVETPEWVNDKTIPILKIGKTDNGYIQFLSKKGGDSTFAPALAWVNQQENELELFTVNNGFPTAETAFGFLKTPELFRLGARPYYSIERLKEIEAYPAFADMSRGHFAELLQYLLEITPQLHSFEKESGIPNADRLVRYFGQAILSKKLVNMGYHPSKPGATRLGKRFMDDAEIQELQKKQEFFFF